MISKVSMNNREILVVDYSNKSEKQMLDLVMEAKKAILADNRPVLLLSIYNDKSYATPKFMMALRQETPEVLHLIRNQAVVGLNATKKMILKGYNFLFRRNIRAFDTADEAIKFLADATKTDKDIPEYWKY